TPPFAAVDVNHQVPARYSPPAPGDRHVSPTGERPVCKQYRSLPSAPAHCFVLLCIAEQYKAMCLHCKTHTHSTQLTH
ncbi:unnamed protein product, partial [Staurois parvus]